MKQMVTLWISKCLSSSDRDNNSEDPKDTDIKKQPENSQKGWTKWIFSIFLLGLIYAHFIWATWYFVVKTNYTLDSTTCTGYGFWMILFIFINFGICYKFVISKYILPAIRAFVWKPISAFLDGIPFSDYIIRGVILVAILIFIVVDSRDDWYRLMPLSGLLIFILIGILLSPFKRQIAWKTLLSGLIAQFVLGLLIIRWNVGRNIFICLGDKVAVFLNYAVEASAFVYGENLVHEQLIFAFNALAAIYLVSFMVNILFYYGIMQSIILKLGIGLQWFLGTSICESVNSAANIFLGQSEAPFVIRPYLDHMTDSELHSIMTGGLASVSGSILAAYMSFGANPAYLISACVITAPAALCYSKLMYPEVEEVEIKENNIEEIQVKFESVLDAAIQGAELASNTVIGIISNLIAFLAVVYFINGVLSWLGVLVGYTNEEELWTLEIILGKIMIPLSFTMGVEWSECESVGQIIGLKSIVNEFVAFQRMENTPLSERSKVITTYAICGFANPGSLGITLSALGALMPKRKTRLSKLIFRAYVGGSIAAFMTGCVAGLLTPLEV